MVIMRAQRPCLIHVGPLFPLTMEHFQNVSQISLHTFMIFYKISVAFRNMKTQGQ